MKRALWFFSVALLLFVPVVGAHAQEQEQIQQGMQQSSPAPSKSAPSGSGIPVWEISGGYSFMRANVGGSGPTINMSGGFGSISQNLNSWFGGRFEMNAWGGTLSGTRVTAESFTYGPVFSLRKSPKYTPFAHIQFGAVHASQGYLGISQSDNKFAMSGGGGVDFHLNDRAGLRFQADYLMTRFLNIREDNIQANFGLVIYLGHVRHGGFLN
jgi:Outer membrane protein beta-barrel domain